jgi:hypothetical protein
VVQRESEVAQDQFMKNSLEIRSNLPHYNVPDPSKIKGVSFILGVSPF